MNFTLIYPPNRNIPSAPYGALPLLAGCLGEAGHRVRVVDANLDVFEELLSSATIEMAKHYYDTGWAELHAKETMTPDELGRLQALGHLGLVPFEELLQAERAGEILRTKELFGDPEKLNWAYDTIANVLRLTYSLNPLYYGHSPTFCDDLFGYLSGGFDNPIKQIVEHKVLPKILATEPDVVGVCIPFNEQLVEAFSLVAQLRRALPDVKIVVGGAIVTAFHETLCADPRFYEYADFAMPGEADLSLPQLVTALEEGGDLSEVPNLWRRDEAGEIHPPCRKDLPNLNDIAHPDFAPIEIDRYFLPEPLATYQTSRGCYYGKCTFCSFDIKQNFRFRKAELVIEDILRMQEYGVRHFTFWDPLTPPRLMKAIARWNKERPADEQIYWGAETKFEKIFTDQKFTDLLYEGGARFMQFGFESGSQRMLDLMVKGNDLERVHLMLAALKQSNIAVSVQWFIGFPGETEEEAIGSYQYLDEHRDSILLSSYMGKFTLSPDDDIFRSGGDLYDVDIDQAPDGRFEYSYRDGSPRYDTDELHNAYLSRGDAESVTRFAFFVYLTEFPDRVREISNFERGGKLPLDWDDIADQVPVRPAANFTSSFDFDIFTPCHEQVAPEGSARPKVDTHAVFVTQTQLTHRLTADEVRLVEGADGERTFAQLLSDAGLDTPEMRRRVLGFVRMGILVAPKLARVVAA